MPRLQIKTPGKPLPIKAYRTNDLTNPTPHRHHLVQVILNAGMGAQHDGLRLLMESMDIDHEALQPGQFVVFLNRRRTKAKIYTAHGVIAYMRTEDESEISFEMLSRIPQAFQAPGTISALDPLRLAIDTGLEAPPPRPYTGSNKVIVRRQGVRPELR